MIKEALDFLSKLQQPTKPVTIKVGEDEYSVETDWTLGEPIRKPDLSYAKAPLALSTLSGLVTAYKAKVGQLGERVALHVVSHLQVDLVDLDQDEFGKRRVYASAKHEPDAGFKFNTYPDPEPFLLQFRAGFYFNEEAVKVQKLCSTIGAASGVAAADDSVSQEVTVKSGTVTKAGVTLPADGVQLIPWRTFRDANPVESRFLLRMRGVKDALPQIALFEIDARWKLDTVNSIRSYLAGALGEATIIA